MYRLLEPVKVVMVLDFELTADPLHNAKDIVVHWDITELMTNMLASELLSWTFVVLPRYTDKLCKEGDIGRGSNFPQPKDTLS